MTKPTPPDVNKPTPPDAPQPKAATPPALPAINYILYTAHGALPMTVEEFQPAMWFR